MGSSPQGTLKLLAECLPAAAISVAVIGGAIGLLVHYGHAGLP